MPFLTYPEFEHRLSVQLAENLHTEGTNPIDPAAFAAAEADAAAEIKIRTGVSAPATATTADDWAKFCTFALVVWHRIGVLPNISEQHYAWAKQMHDHAEELLALQAQILGWQVGSGTGNGTTTPFNRTPFARYNKIGTIAGLNDF